MRIFKFKIGDIIRCVSNEFDDKDCKGKLGKIITKYSKQKFKPYLIQFFKPVEDGHDGEGKGKDGHCRWFREEEIKLHILILKLFLKEKENETQI